MNGELDDWEPMDDNWLTHYAAMSRHERRFNDFSGSTVRQLAIEVQRLRAEREAIDALHQPVTSGEDDEVCDECVFFWPCRTHVLLHPEEASHER